MADSQAEMFRFRAREIDAGIRAVENVALQLNRPEWEAAAAVLRGASVELRKRASDLDGRPYR